MDDLVPPSYLVPHSDLSTKKVREGLVDTVEPCQRTPLGDVTNSIRCNMTEMDKVEGDLVRGQSLLGKRTFSQVV